MSVNLERRLLSEYLALPGLNLSLAQATRLLDTDRRSCRTTLDALVAGGWLTYNAAGLYVRPPAVVDLQAWKRHVRRRLAAAPVPSTTVARGMPARASRRSGPRHGADRMPREPAAMQLE